MKKCFTLLCILLFVKLSYAQSDTMYVDIGTEILAFPVSTISQMFFDAPTGVDEQDDAKIQQILNTFILQQNYPNPFNPSTNITYSLPQAGNVSVNIYNINGQLIRNILSEQQNAGQHIVVWDSKTSSGVNAANGIYFYQVQFNQTTLTKKMILIK